MEVGTTPDHIYIQPTSRPLYQVRAIRASGSHSLLAKVDEQGLHLYDRRGGVNHLLTWTELEAIHQALVAATTN